MLVVSRRPLEEIVIGDEIKVRVVEVRPGRVRLAIDAPSWMNVVRGEIVEADHDVKPSISLSTEE